MSTSDAPKIAAKSLANLNRSLAAYWQDLGKPERAQACEASAAAFDKMASRDAQRPRSASASDDPRIAALADHNRRRAAYYRAQGDHECAARCERIAAALDNRRD